MQGGGIINRGAGGAIIYQPKYTLICYEGIMIGAAGGAIIRKYVKICLGLKLCL
jgi:hypothetical protein